LRGKGGEAMKKILKSSIKELLRRSTGQWQVYAPVESEQGDVLFSLLSGAGDEFDKMLDAVNLDDEWTVMSPKDVFFPQQEDMFHFDKDRVREKVEKSRKLIFGIRPCDLKGVLFADEFFKRNFEDAYYLSRANDRLIVTIGCLTPPRPSACFCTSAKTGPFAEDGYDLQLADAGNEYIVEVGSRQGEKFIDSNSGLFTDAGKDASAKLEKVKLEAAKKVELKIDFEKALELMKGEHDFEENYRRISERCIYCGACLYTCPTCTCFNVFDQINDGKGVRRRNWDACVFEGYTREASGHNPRNDKALRTARRYEHKLKYDYSTAGRSGCIGCGRCLASCPVNIGMSKFIEEITSGKQKM